MQQETIYSLKDVCKTYQPEGILALNHIHFEIYREEIFGLVGESGSGKSTCARVVSQLEEVDSGQCLFEGRDISNLSDEEMFSLRREIQFVFQDPCAALNPMHRILETLIEPLQLHADYLRLNASPMEQISELLEKVGLCSNVLSRFPHQFSGGQKHRIGLARALVLEPRLLVCDEPLSALDISIQAQIVNLLLDLRDNFSLTILIVAHDLLMMRYMCDRLGVMYGGTLVEVGPVHTVYDNPQHPYTQLLIDAIPIPNPEKQRKRVPKIVVPKYSLEKGNKETGCPFALRCPFAMDVCFAVRPTMTSLADGRSVACHLFPSSGS
ncbi:oligopeptide/dipeptide ABC transporter ATP-binding protein [Candidatus Similichlamydia laticola]|uniref:Oligopeptide transport ATP-binding protein OppF n=1 Tax=Candidatus Similichlamydia laticola TaxID=2170265 RepID=A0A369KFA4_9BACT|nr:ABC transporter ATP-binding protein [Candidatus Similichlamydia laticola]RDB31577.1 Oligopeptide transport ATP-binding protein OppF [Candidatus Similichlamydia laticola]